MLDQLAAMKPQAPNNVPMNQYFLKLGEGGPEGLADKLGRDDEDVRLRVLAELAVAGWSIAGREWVHTTDRGGRSGLVERLHNAFAAVPEALALSC